MAWAHRHLVYRCIDKELQTFVILLRRVTTSAYCTPRACSGRTNQEAQEESWLRRQQRSAIHYIHPMAMLLSSSPRPPRPDMKGHCARCHSTQESHAWLTASQDHFGDEVSRARATHVRGHGPYQFQGCRCARRLGQTASIPTQSVRERNPGPRRRTCSAERGIGNAVRCCTAGGNMGGCTGTPLAASATYAETTVAHSAVTSAGAFGRSGRYPS